MWLQGSQNIVGRKPREPDARVGGVPGLFFRAVHSDRPRKTVQSGNELISLAAQFLALSFGGFVGQYFRGCAHADAERDGHRVRPQAVLLAAPVNQRLDSVLRFPSNKTDQIPFGPYILCAERLRISTYSAKNSMSIATGDCAASQ